MPGAEWLVEAFWDLTHDRPIGLSLGAIPFTAIDRYAARFRVFDPDEFETMHRMIRAMDDVFLEEAAKKAKSGK